jgi:hypothetical protein
VSLSDTNINFFVLGTLSTSCDFSYFGNLCADYQNSCKNRTVVHPMFTLTQYSADVEITTALNYLNNSVVERNLLSGNITCRSYRDTTAVDKPIYLAW